jgi:murein DD-endopeptidase MepM/ murein hydrolase activator NlpD
VIDFCGFVSPDTPTMQAPKNDHEYFIPNARPPRTWARFNRRHKAALATGLVGMFSMVTAFGLPTPSANDSQLRQQIVLEHLALHLDKPIFAEEYNFLREERIQKGDTVSNLLHRLDVIDDAALNFIRQHPAAQVIFKQLAPGKLVSAKISSNGELRSLHFPLNNKDTYLVVEKHNTTFHIAERLLETQVHTEMHSGEIRTSLFGATDAAGIPDGIATQLAEIFSGDIDFYRDLRKGDRFSLIYEMHSSQGQNVKSGRILAAEFINNGQSFRAVLFPPPGITSNAPGGYYTPEGKNLRKAFLRSPLEFSRVTSGFSNARLHPILNQWRAHRGVDYGAPTGTRVRATADGVVEFSGRQGGYGNLVVLRHNGRYSTAYGHLNAFAPGVRSGARVKQGDTIGYVGATGWATGPHLHYEFRINGEQVNPLAAVLPPAPSLDNTQLSHFRLHAGSVLSQLNQVNLATTSVAME